MRASVLYLCAFVTGGCLLSFELLNTKLLEPYFGQSLYVWASTIGTTMIGLALGYYLSSKMSLKNQGEKNLFLISTLLFLDILFLIVVAPLLLSALQKLDIMVGIFVATVIVNMPLHALFGFYSPLIINTIQNNTNNAEIGEVSGIVYGVSALGGVVFLIGTAIYGLPILGFKITMLSVAFIVFMLVALFFIKSRVENE